MYRTHDTSYQTIVYLIAGLTMLAASFNILTHNLNLASTPLSIIIGVFIAYQEAWGLRVKQLITPICIPIPLGAAEPINHEPDEPVKLISHDSDKPVELTYFELTWRKLVSDLMPATISTSMAMNPARAKFDTQVELILYDIIVEATKNIVQHAQAKVAEVKIDVLEKTTLLFIQDDGVGFTVRKVMPNATGLQRIKKQVEALSGTVMFDSAKGKGTAILIEFPNQPS